LTNQADTLPFAAIGADVTIWPLAKIVSPESITLGDSVIIDDFVFLVGGRSTRLGSFVHVASFVSVLGGGEFVMDDFAGVSSGTRVYTGNDDYSGACLTGPTVPAPYRVPERSFVHLGKHVVVGANSVILPGVSIGEGAIVGANSLVKKSCDPWTINVGTPARVVGQRPRERILELEAQLRQDLYTSAGRYIPRAERGGAPPQPEGS
jgi:galactoside O-acetyltransferase